MLRQVPNLRRRMQLRVQRTRFPVASRGTNQEKRAQAIYYSVTTVVYG